LYEQNLFRLNVHETHLKIISFLLHSKLEKQSQGEIF
jgi:hypothetical protein